MMTIEAERRPQCQETDVTSFKDDRNYQGTQEKHNSKHSDDSKETQDEEATAGLCCQLLSQLIQRAVLKDAPKADLKSPKGSNR